MSSGIAEVHPSQHDRMISQKSTYPSECLLSPISDTISKTRSVKTQDTFGLPIGSHLNILLLSAPLAAIANHIDWGAQLRFNLSLIAIIALVKVGARTTSRDEDCSYRKGAGVLVP